MKVITMNLNGIRSAAKKGFFTWLEQQNADVICLQETRAQEHQIQESIYKLQGYHCFFFDAEKKGYSGVAIYTKHKPDKVTKGLGFDVADTEGRYIQVDFPKISIASIYLPSGTSGDERQAIKYAFLDKYMKILKKQLTHVQEYIIAGDWNIAHNEIDLKNWRTNQKCSGFLPEERAWMEELFTKVGFVDSFRYKYPAKVLYTWWSNRANAWNNNVGWRIDYQVITKGLKDKILNATAYREQKFSDHAPFIVEYDYQL